MHREKNQSYEKIARKIKRLFLRKARTMRVRTEREELENFAHSINGKIFKINCFLFSLIKCVFSSICLGYKSIFPHWTILKRGRMRKKFKRYRVHKIDLMHTFTFVLQFWTQLYRSISFGPYYNMLFANI